MTLLKWLAGAGVLFGCIVVAMYALQRSLMYFPENIRTPPAAAGFAAAEDIVLETADGEKLVAWFVPPRGDKPLVLYFHGNGGALRYRVDRFRVLAADGTGPLALSYRGYGGSTGQPTEEGLLRDADAAYGFAAARVPAERIVLWGESLGTGVAVALAAKSKVGGVILESPFTSTADIGALRYPFLPVRWLMKDQFHSDERIAKVTARLLILHGERDRVVPFAFGQQLFALANEPKRFVPFPQGDHNDLDAFGAQAEARAFLRQVAP